MPILTKIGWALVAFGGGTAALHALADWLQYMAGK